MFILSLPCFYQIQVSATDMGSPPQKSENSATVTVTVDRNKNTPTFVRPDQYKVTISEKFAAGSEVFRFSVTDADTKVSCLILKNHGHTDKM